MATRETEEEYFPVNRVKRYLLDADNWIDVGGLREDAVVTHYAPFPEFTLRVERISSLLDYDDEWSRGEAEPYDNHSHVLVLMYHQTPLAEVRHVEFRRRKEAHGGSLVRGDGRRLVPFPRGGGCELGAAAALVRESGPPPSWTSRPRVAV